jgi:enterochelin esterase family protein
MKNKLSKRARDEGAPIIDGERGQATFVWRGRSTPQLIGDFNEWGGEEGVVSAPVEMTESKPGVWTHTLALPQDAYIEYCFLHNGRRVLDPLNPHATPNGVGDRNNYFYMPGAAPTPLALRQRGTPRGEVTRYTVEAGDLIVGGKRTVYLYQPPVTEPCPLLVVLDGQDYLRRARLPVIVDNLIAPRRIRPVALALVNSSAPARFVEYACSDATLSFLTQVVVPFARARLRLADVGQGTNAYGIVGASMGGLMALYAAVRAPEVFGCVLSQSGAFSVPNHDFVVFDLVRHTDPKSLRIWMDAGKFEGLLDCNRRMHHLLTEKGYQVTYREYSGGHNYPAWRDDLPHGLEALYGVG